MDSKYRVDKNINPWFKGKNHIPAAVAKYTANLELIGKPCYKVTTQTWANYIKEIIFKPRDLRYTEYHIKNWGKKDAFVVFYLKWRYVKFYFESEKDAKRAHNYFFQVFGV